MFLESLLKDIPDADFLYSKLWISITRLYGHVKTGIGKRITCALSSYENRLDRILCF